ncbi:MAG: methyltransferase domain-containing protein [Acidobacteriota bacterium]
MRKSRLPNGARTGAAGGSARLRGLGSARLSIGILLLGALLLTPADSRSSPELTGHAIETRAGELSSSSYQRSSRKPRRLRKPDVIYYSTPAETVAEMLRIAGPKKGDVLYDLGSGDGRIPIAAAQQYGIRAIGIEIDPKLVIAAEENAGKANVSALVSFRNDDMFIANLSEATIVTLYLSDKLNVLLRPKLLRELRPGARIVSHDFRMGDWKPEQSVRVPWGKLYRTVYLWTVPTPGRIRKSPRSKLSSHRSS